MQHYIIKIFLIILGVLSLILGTLGVLLPILPTAQFFLTSTFCFAKSSKKLDLWFKNISIYKNHFEDFVKKGTMPLKTKTILIISITFFMRIGFIFMNNLIIDRIVLFTVWFTHIIYFAFIVKTDEA